MIRTQVYLTEEERNAVATIAKNTQKSRSEIIRQAIDLFFEQNKTLSREIILQQARGLWRDRKDLPDFSALRDSI